MNEKCFKHPNKEAINFCHVCKRYFCSECLTKGDEYYYCQNEQCQSTRVNDSKKIEDSNNDMVQNEMRKSALPLSLKLVSYFWILISLPAAFSIISSIIHGKFQFFINVLGLWIGIGLLNLKPKWHTCALIVTWINIVSALIFGIIIPVKQFGLFLNSNIVYLLIQDFLLIWAYFVIQKPSIRILFGKSPERKHEEKEGGTNKVSNSLAKSYRAYLIPCLIIVTIIVVGFLMIIFLLPKENLYTVKMMKWTFQHQDNKALYTMSIGSANGTSTRYLWEGDEGAREGLWNFAGINMPFLHKENLITCVNLRVKSGSFSLFFLDEEKIEIASLKATENNKQSLEFILPATALKEGRYKIVAEKAKGIFYEIFFIFPETTAEYYHFGIICFKNGHMDQAKIALEKSIDLNPYNDLAYFNLGSVFLYKKDYDNAITMFNISLELEPEDAIAYLNLGNAFQGKKNYDKAIAMYRKALEFDPKYTNAYNNWGNALVNIEDYHEAISKYQEALKINPQYANAYRNMGNALGKLDDYDGAITSFKKSIEFDPNCAMAYGGMGWMYYLKGDFNKCIELSKKAIALEPSDIQTQFNIALSYLRLGQIKKAKAMYEKTRKPDGSIDHEISQDVINELQELIDQNIMAEEAQMILTEIFDLKDKDIHQ